MIGPGEGGHSRRPGHPKPIPRDPGRPRPGKPQPGKPKPGQPGYKPTGGMTAAQSSAFDQMDQFLSEYGLSSLSGFVKNLIVGGTTDSASIMLQLQGTNEWKQRFAGNEALKQKGLGVLSPAEYLSVERSYAQIMKNYGLPVGFYDDPSDFAQWIGGNVSAAEIQQRVSAYADLANREDPATLAQLNSMGMTKGDLLAYMMDPSRAQPLLQQKYQQTLLGAASRRAGYVADNNYLGELASRGVTEQQAAQGFGLVAENLHAAQTLGGVYGEDVSGQDLASMVFDNDAASGKKIKRLASQERGAFGGSSGVAGGSLNKNTSGSY